MKKFLIGLTLAAVLVLTVATVAFAEVETPLFPGGRGPGGQGGSGGPGDGTGDMHDYIVDAQAEALGITVDEFLARREAGETLYDIATSLGLDLDQLTEVLTQARNQAMEQAYGDGLMTQEQYEFWLNNGGMGRMGGGQGGRGGQGGTGGQGSGGFGGACPFTNSDS
jgi:hypothetical protein